MERLTIPSTWEAVQDAGQKVLTAALECGYDESCAFSIRLALEEAMINAVKHGNGCDPNKKIEVEYDVTPEKIEILVTDEGTGFDPGVLPDPTCQENIEKPTGRGVMLMRAFMDSVEYSERGNQVRMIKRRGEAC